MARLTVVFVWNGETGEYTFPDSFTVPEIEKKIEKCSKAKIIRIPSCLGEVACGHCRSVYLVPYSNIIRFVVDLEENESCPDPNCHKS